MNIEGIPGFWKIVSSKPHRLLALDYDGTLAPFRIERMDAEPLPGILESLSTLSDRRSCRNTTLAVISGRPANEVSQLLDNLAIPLYGTHGYEYLDEQNALRLFSPDEANCDGLNTALRAAQSAGLFEMTEKKISSVAIHTRGRDNAQNILDRIIKLWEPIAQTTNLKIRHFDGGVEMRATDRDKATAIQELLETCPRGTLPVYIGDDDTDEDAFQFLRKTGGYGIRVGDKRQQTAALGSLPNCESVLRFLHTWRRIICPSQAKTIRTIQH
ncbi:MAG: trehalose-phosphatase [Calditrichota bacterium]